MGTYVKLRSDLVTSSSSIDGNKVFTVKDPITGRYFRLREPEFWLSSRLDGKTSPEEVARLMQQRWKMNITTDDISQFIATLDEYLFLDNSRSEQVVSRKSSLEIEQRSIVGRLLFIKIKAFSPGRLLDWLATIYRPFHNLYGLLFASLFLAMGVYLFLVNIDQFYIRLFDILQVGSLPLLLFSIFVLIALHEFAHGALCRYYGGQVREIGFLLMYFQPCFYCDLSDAWLFEKKSQRIAVSFAGPFFQLLVVAAAVMVWRVTDPGNVINISARMMVVVGWITFFFNFNPLIKLDGYYMLSDWVDIPNLRSKAFGYITNSMKRNILGWPIDTITVNRREKKIFLIYGTLATIYTAFLILYLLYWFSSYLTDVWGPSGLILVIFIMAVILRGVALEFGRGVIQHFRYMKKLFRQPLRLATHIVLFSSVLVAAWAIPLPHRVSGKVSVKPIRQFSLSLKDSGLLESSVILGGAKPERKSSFLQMTSTDMAALELLPRVFDGERIKRGDTVAILTSNQIVRELGRNKAELESLQGKLSLLKAPPKKEQLAEANAQVIAAQANLDQLEREQQRINQLVERKLEANDKLETATSEVNIAKAELANKQSTLKLLKSPPRPEEEAVLLSDIRKQQAEVDYLLKQHAAQTLVSPIAGTVIAASDERILSVVDNGKIELLVPVSDFDISLISIGQIVSLKVRSFPSQIFLGEVVRIPEIAESIEDKAYFLVSVVVNNKEGLLHQGMSGYAKIAVGESSAASLAWRKLQSLLRVEFWFWW